MATSEGNSSVEAAKANKRTKRRSLLQQIFGGGKKNETLKVLSPTTAPATDAPSDVPQTSSSSQPSYPLFVGKHTYLSQTDSDLGFKEGDLLYILNKDDTDWWFAKAKHSGQEGYIPSNYVTEHKSTVDKGENVSSGADAVTSANVACDTSTQPDNTQSDVPNEPPPPESLPPPEDKNVYLTLFPYEARTPEDLGFVKPSCSLLVTWMGTGGWENH